MTDCRLVASESISRSVTKIIYPLCFQKLAERMKPSIRIACLIAVFSCMVAVVSFGFHKIIRPRPAGEHGIVEKFIAEHRRHYLIETQTGRLWTMQRSTNRSVILNRLVDQIFGSETNFISPAQGNATR
jgi:hypothetical protein